MGGVVYPHRVYDPTRLVNAAMTMEAIYDHVYGSIMVSSMWPKETVTEAVERAMKDWGKPI